MKQVVRYLVNSMNLEMVGVVRIDLYMLVEDFYALNDTLDFAPFYVLYTRVLTRRVLWTSTIICQ